MELAQQLLGQHYQVSWKAPALPTDSAGDSMVLIDLSGEVFWYGSAEWNKSTPLIYKTEKGTTILKGMLGGPLRSRSTGGPRKVQP